MARAAEERKERTVDKSLRLWFASDNWGDFTGYYISEADPHVPVAILLERYRESIEYKRIQAQVMVIMGGACNVERADRAIDLRGYGRPDSLRRTPGYLYSLWLSEITHLESMMAEPGQPTPLNPFCPVRAAAWAGKAPAAPTRAIDLGAITWEHVTLDPDESLGAEWPTPRLPVYVRPGMAVQIPEASGCGIAETISRDFCIIRLENGSSQALHWNNVAVCGAAPDPAYLIARGGAV